MPQKISRTEYDRRLDELCDRYRNGTTPALARQLNESLAAFKASVVIVEKAPARPASRHPAARPVRETAPSRSAPRPTASKPSKRERRITRIVRETLTAAAAPKPAPATAAPVQRPPAAKMPPQALHEMSADELAAATVAGVGGASPFWQPRESAPAAPVLESVAVDERDARDLASLSNDGLDAVFDRLNQRRGLASPLWVA
jgi:hypothetical protein